MNTSLNHPGVMVLALSACQCAELLALDGASCPKAVAVSHLRVRRREDLGSVAARLVSNVR